MTRTAFGSASWIPAFSSASVTCWVSIDSLMAPPVHEKVSPYHRPRKRALHHSAQSFTKRPRALEGDLVQVRLLRPGHEVLVAGPQLIDQPQLEPAPRQPVLAGGDPVEVQLWPVRLDELLEELVRVLELLLELAATALADLAEHAHGPLELARSHLLEVDVVLLQQAVEVGHLRDHPDRSDDRERRRDDAVGHAGYHVAAARRDAVDADGDRDRALAQAHQLGGGEAVVRHGAPGALEADDHLVVLAGDRGDGGDLFAQVPD